MQSVLKKTLRNMVMYQVYVRNHTEAGTFKALEADLDRIKDLGVDLIHLLPVHPIGKENRKGSLGSPYAIADYRSINPELGTEKDFTSLVDAIHRRGMKCIMDIVYNHTSPDSWLAKNKPRWFYRKPGGAFGSRIGDWWDVIDLDYGDSESGLWDYQIETLKYWAKTVDGFRCDAASLVPLEFWLRAREETAALKPDCFWLAESVEPSFILENRRRGINCHSDSELFQAFDVCYDYDIYGFFKHAGESGLEAYAEKINAQEYIYPDNYVKLRNLENHDQERAKALIPNSRTLRNWTAFNYFQKGLALIYAGQEWENDFRPSLFEKDTLKRDTGHDLSSLMKSLYRIKKDGAFTDSNYTVHASGGIVSAVHEKRSCSGEHMAGIFCLDGTGAGTLRLPFNVPGGTYINLIDGSSFCIENSSMVKRATRVRK